MKELLNENKRLVGGFCLLFIVLFVAAFLIGTAIILGVWNYVLVPVFHLSPIDWPQAFLIYAAIALIGSAFRATTNSS